MEKCLHCDTALEVIKDRAYRYRESGLDFVYLSGVLQYRCPKCGETSVEIPRVNDLHLLIGKALVCKKGLLAGDEVKFLRKEIGMKGKEIAAALSIEPETYSRWENGKRGVAPCHDKSLRMMYVMSASEKFGKVLSRDSISILSTIAIDKAPIKTRGKIKISSVEWLHGLNEPIFGEACYAV
jgi:putative zinc finger/helix-turn-helix YgiT family protein